MKKIVMTISVFVDDQPVSDCGQYSCEVDQITKALYDHICEWDFNVHVTVDVIHEQIIENAVIGVD